LPIRIKNWERFQHFKDRRPPWIKLYRDIIDDVDFHELDPLSAKHLILIWIIASETDGVLPCTKKLAFRLHTTEKQVESTVSKLSHWLIHDDISTISARYQVDTPETETETETETDVHLHDTQDLPAIPVKKRERLTPRYDYPRDFMRFWSEYPRRENKSQAFREWEKEKKYNPKFDLEKIVGAARTYSTEVSETEQRFIKMPSTFLHAGTWLEKVYLPEEATA
jgi:hypothetical protein